MSRNQIKELPEELFNLKKLKELYVILFYFFFNLIQESFNNMINS